MTILKQTKYFNRRLALACTLIAVSSFNYGFDNQGFATTQAMDAFAKQFGVYDSKTQSYMLEPSWLSLFNSLNYIGFGAGVLIGSLISARFGRRMCMFCMSCFALVTATIVITSKTREQIMAARVLNYLYVGMELSVVPVFQSEIVPAPARGFIVGTYQFSLILGGLVINAICRGTKAIEDNRAWRIPFGFFYVVPSIVLCGVWFVPESPRWLLLQDRAEEAKANLRKLRAGNLSDAEIDDELASLQFALQKETEQGHYKEMFQGVNLKRTCIVVIVNFFQQATGQAFASQYGAIFVKSLHTVDPFNMTLINAAINAIFIMFCLGAVDYVGRRPLLEAGAIVQIIGLMTMGGLGSASNVTSSIKIGIVAMISVFGAGFSLGWAPLTYVVTTELPALRLRDKTMRVGFVVNVAMNFAVNFSIPYLIYPQYAGLESKVGFIFGAIAVLALVFTYFCVPECTGKSLEQIDIMFHDGVPLRKFGQYDCGENPDGALVHDASEKNTASAHHEEMIV